MGLFATHDRTRALRTRRIRHLGDEVTADSRARAFLEALPSLGALGTVVAAVVLATAVIALGRWTALGGMRGVLVLGLSSALLAFVITLAARAFAPHVLQSAAEAARPATLIIATLVVTRVLDKLAMPYLAPVPLAGAIAVIAYGPAFALALGVPLALGAGLVRALDPDPVLADGIEFAAALGLAYSVAVVLCRRISGRGTLMRAGFAAGGVLAVALLVVRGLLASPGLYRTGPPPSLNVSHFWLSFPPPGSYDVVWALLNGGLLGFVLFELLPVIERVTGALTDIRLAELADLNRPILKKMNLEAPGTFHHSQVVARLAEAAAEAIGANGLLARVGAYYHDLGKMAKPVYFTENNKESAKKHGALAPTLSALVIHAHVKDGIELARDLGLPEKIVSFIPEHHGTTACEFFYRQAAREAKARGEAVDKEVFRYPGPRPRSKETAIVHLADSCEAVTRSLAEPGLARIQNVVREVVMDKLLDHQLDDSPLTIGDLRMIQESFVRVLTGIYHGRVKYPERLQGTQGEQRLQRLAKLRGRDHGDATPSTTVAAATPPPGALPVAAGTPAAAAASPSATAPPPAAQPVTATTMTAALEPEATAPAASARPDPATPEAFDAARPKTLGQERPQGYEPPMTW